MLLSPSDIDVDHRGRVWVCEVVNYRGRNGQRPEGRSHPRSSKTPIATAVPTSRPCSTRAATSTRALGICVLGNKVIVSVAPNVFVFTDSDGDGKADKKEVLFTKVGNPQHDHSTHAFVFGPDGKLYWNVGNEGHAVHDKNGKPIVDLAGNAVNDSGKPYRQGMVFRCNFDGSDFETLAHNFRNNYEVAVDSFGTLWQSDNDDDGNQGRAHQLRDGVRQLWLRRRKHRRGLASAPDEHRDRDSPPALASKRSGRGAEPVADRRRIADRHLRLRGNVAAAKSSATR